MYGQYQLGEIQCMRRKKLSKETVFCLLSIVICLCHAFPSISFMKEIFNMLLLNIFLFYQHTTTHGEEKRISSMNIFTWNFWFWCKIMQEQHCKCWRTTLIQLLLETRMEKLHCMCQLAILPHLLVKFDHVSFFFIYFIYF